MTFAYDVVSVLEDVTLTIPKGRMLAIVGRSGAGKSTLTDLILRLHDPTRGLVTIDGIDLKELRQEPFRHLFGVVSQESLLFNDTVLNNIRYGRSEISDERIRDAARIAKVYEFAARLPQGYDTVVGDRGIRLSGGQRQRVALARAIAHRPDVLILDEATNSLDSESEHEVQAAINEIIHHTTVIVISHRLSTVQHADAICVLDRGSIVDVGRHEELLVRCALYRNLCELQFLDVGRVAGVGDEHGTLPPTLAGGHNRSTTSE